MQLVVPAAFDRGKLRGLMLQHVEPRQVAKKELDRDDQRDERQAPMQHHARLGAMKGGVSNV